MVTMPPPAPHAWKVGDRRAITHTFTAEELAAFAALTGDDNPLHMNGDYARRTYAGERVVHGMLAASFVSTLIGREIPGPGALWNSFSVNWRRMIRIGDTLTIEARVTAVNAATRTLDLEIAGVDHGSGETCLDGTAKVMIMEETPAANTALLSGKTALVTGASGEVGGAICRRLAAAGCRVILWGRDAARLARIKAELGGTVLASHGVELEDAAAVESALNAMLGVSPVEIFVHAASAPLDHEPLGSSAMPRALARHWAVSAAAFAQIANRLVAQSTTSGAMVALLTQAVIDSPPEKMSAYVAAKMALWGLVRSIAVECGRKGFRCNAVSPGMINTPMTKDVPVRAKQVEAATNPLRRLCTADDVADAVAFLCGPQAAYINGVNLPVSGGARTL